MFAGVWSLTQVMPGSRGSSPRTVGRSRDGGRRGAGAGRASWCLWAREEADNYLYHLWLISRTHITQDSRLQLLSVSSPGHRGQERQERRGFLKTLWIHEDVMPVRLSVSVNFSRTGRFTLCSCPCHSLHALLEFAYPCCEITCKTCAKMCADYIKQSVIIHSPHTSRPRLSDAISGQNKF